MQPLTAPPAAQGSTGGRPPSPPAPWAEAGAAEAAAGVPLFQRLLDVYGAMLSGGWAGWLRGGKQVRDVPGFEAVAHLQSDIRAVQARLAAAHNTAAAAAAVAGGGSPPQAPCALPAAPHSCSPPQPPDPTPAAPAPSPVAAHAAKEVMFVSGSDRLNSQPSQVVVGSEAAEGTLTDPMAGGALVRGEGLAAPPLTTPTTPLPAPHCLEQQGAQQGQGRQQGGHQGGHQGQGQQQAELPSRSDGDPPCCLSPAALAAIQAVMPGLVATAAVPVPPHLLTLFPTAALPHANDVVKEQAAAGAGAGAGAGAAAGAGAGVGAGAVSEAGLAATAVKEECLSSSGGAGAELLGPAILPWSVGPGPGAGGKSGVASPWANPGWLDSCLQLQLPAGQLQQLFV
ncbi:hypothetical protein V8C86DRAFT_1150245 [Haematococcus lacustris]